MTDRPTLARVIQQAIKANNSELHTAFPGIVDSYNAETQMCSVQPCFKRKYKEEEAAITLPLVQNVPVVWCRTASAAVHLPLAKGDSVLLVVSERSIDRWVSEGGVVDPQNTRTHDLSDCVAIPGLFSSNQALELDDGDTSRVVVQIGAAKITLDKSGDIRIGQKGSAQTEPLVLGNILSSFLSAFINTLNTVPAGITSAPGSLIGINPALVTALDNLKTQFIDTAASNILSKRYFTERGS